MFGHKGAELISVFLQTATLRKYFQHFKLKLLASLFIYQSYHILQLIHNCVLVLLWSARILLHIKIILNILHSVHIDQSGHPLPHIYHLCQNFHVLDECGIENVVGLVPGILIITWHVVHLNQFLIKEKAVSLLVLLHYLEKIMLTNAPIIRNTQASKEHLLIALRPRIQHIINHLNKRENVRSIERIELCLQKYHQLLPNILRIPILQKLLKRISVQAGVLLADIRFLKAHTAEEASYFFIINQIQIINFVPDHILLDILHAQKALIPLIQNIFLFKIGVQLSKK